MGRLTEESGRVKTSIIVVTYFWLSWGIFFAQITLQTGTDMLQPEDGVPTSIAKSSVAYHGTWLKFENTLLDASRIIKTQAYAYMQAQQSQAGRLMLLQPMLVGMYSCLWMPYSWVDDNLWWWLSFDNWLAGYYPYHECHGHYSGGSFLLHEEDFIQKGTVTTENDWMSPMASVRVAIRMVNVALFGPFKLIRQMKDIVLGSFGTSAKDDLPLLKAMCPSMWSVWWEANLQLVKSKTIFQTSLHLVFNKDQRGGQKLLAKDMGKAQCNFTPWSHQIWSGLAEHSAHSLSSYVAWEMRSSRAAPSAVSDPAMVMAPSVGILDSSGGDATSLLSCDSEFIQAAHANLSFRQASSEADSPAARINLRCSWCLSTSAFWGLCVKEVNSCWVCDLDIS